MDWCYRQLAAKYIRRQAKQLAEQLDGIRAAEDIEYVHRARVATRRLRAAMRMFGDCFERKPFRRWRKAIRRTTAKLGKARDRDVQIEFLCGVLSGLGATECFPGIARILVQAERDRERLQRKVVKAVNRLEVKDVLRQMRRAMKKILREDDLSVQQGPTPETYDRIRGHILRRLDELLCHQNSLVDPDDCRRHHAMRIAAKRLRYTLEIARPVYAGRLDEFVAATKQVQSLLGDVHDCDVWIERLDGFAAEYHDCLMAQFGHAGRMVHLQPGIDFLRADRSGHRKAVFEQLLAFWAELTQRRLWEALAGVILVPGLSPANPPLTPES
jgi:CHAD domain-containing protein